MTIDLIRRYAAPAGLTLALSVPAQAMSPVALVTGQQLVKLMGHVDSRTVHWTAASPFPSRAIAAEFHDMANGEFVNGYIQAVHDATEGSAWCAGRASPKPKPHELIADARLALQHMPNAQLERSAATLIVEVWRQKFPCAEQHRRAT